MTELPDPIDLDNECEMDYRLKVQDLSAIRATQVSQENMAKACMVSIKTIQRFENYKHTNYKLLFKYKSIFNIY